MPSRPSPRERVLVLRQHLGLSQRELAAELGVAVSAVAQWESGARALSGPAERLLEVYERDLGLSINPSDEAVEFLPVSSGRRGRSALAVVAARFFFDHFFTTEKPSFIGARARQLALERYVQTLGQFKGLTMKLGQMLGALDYLLPERERELLTRLQEVARPMPPSMVAAVFFRELKKTPRQVFSEWSRDPIAVASIGQVHAAQLANGQRVAVKIQYPRISEALQADLRNFGILNRFSHLLFSAQKPGVVYEEVKARFLEECDYLDEAEHLRHFARIVGGRAGIAVPEVVDELTTKRVLTMSFAEGMPLDVFASQAPRVRRNEVGSAIWNLWWESIFVHGLYNTDPHPQNFIVNDREVICLDFGRTKVFSDGFPQRFRALVRAVLERDVVGVRDALIALEVAPDPRDFDFDYAYRTLRLLYRPWLMEGNFRFDVDRVRAMAKMMFATNPNRAKMNYCADLVFFHQLMFAINGLMARLEVDIPARAAVLDLLYAPGERRPEAHSAAELA